MENIEKIKSDIENTKDSYRKIAKRYGTNHTQISNLIKKHDWNVEHRDKKKVSKTPKKMEIVEVNPTVDLSEHAKELYYRLSFTGKQVFNHLIKELGNYYTPVLNYQIWLASKDFADFLEISDECESQPYTLTSPKSGQPYINPVHNLYKQKRDTLRSSLNELGLSLSIQKKLNLKFERPGQKQSSIFDIVGELENGDEDLDGI